MIPEIFRAKIAVLLYEFDPKLYSKSAVNLLMLTRAVESNGGKYRKQINGPAISIYQIETTTFDDIYKRVANRYYPDFCCTFAELENCDRKATIIARLKYWSIPVALPAADDIEGLAWYWKKYYNTGLGKGTVEKAIKKYERYCK